MPINKNLERKFRKTYGADLLPVSFTECKLGDIVEWDGFISKSIDFEQISLVHLLKIEEFKKRRLITQLSQVELQAAAFQQITIDKHFDIQAGVDIPNIAAGISADIGFESFINYRISDVNCRILGGELKVELMQLLGQAKKEDPKYFRTKLKKLFFIEKLFYAGQVSFELKSEAKGKLVAALGKAKIADPRLSFTSSGNAIVTFPGSTTIPFAADIEPCMDLVD